MPQICREYFYGHIGNLPYLLSRISDFVNDKAIIGKENISRRQLGFQHLIFCHAHKQQKKKTSDAYTGQRSRIFLCRKNKSALQLKE